MDSKKTAKENTEKESNNIVLKKAKNTFFQNQQILVDNLRAFSYLNYSLHVTEYSCCYEIFNLKNNKNNNSFFITYCSEGNRTIICKYNYEMKQIEEVEVEDKVFTDKKSEKKIKYFDDPLSKNEYLFFIKDNALLIYLIKSEKEYEFVDEYKKEGGLGGYCISRAFLPIYNFEIFYNKYDQKNYLIISYFYQRGCMSNRYDIDILNFEGNKLNVIKSFYFLTFNEKKLFLLYEDKNSKTYYLIIYVKNSIKYIEINNDFLNEYEEDIDEFPNFFDLINNMDDFYKKLFCEFGCIIYGNDKNDDILLLSDRYGTILIIDLNKKELIKNLTLQININCICDYLDNKIILGMNNSIFVFDVDLGKIITKYEFDFKDDDCLISIQKIICENNNTHFIIIGGSDRKLRLLY